MPKVIGYVPSVEYALVFIPIGIASGALGYGLYHSEKIEKIRGVKWVKEKLGKYGEILVPPITGLAVGYASNMIFNEYHVGKMLNWLLAEVLQLKPRLVWNNLFTTRLALTWYEKVVPPMYQVKNILLSGLTAPVGYMLGKLKDKSVDKLSHRSRS